MTKQNAKRIKSLISKTKDGFEKAMDDDLNTSNGLAAIFDFIKEINKIGIEKLDKKLSKQILDLLNNFDSVFGLDLLKTKEIKIPEEVLKLTKEREESRKTKQWQRADEIRQRIQKLGYKIEDTEKGAKIKKI